MTAVGDWADGLRRWAMAGLLLLLYLFLYAPILYVIYASFSQDIVWPFPPSFTTDAYRELLDNALYADALKNSLLIGLGSGNPVGVADAVVWLVAGLGGLALSGR